MLSFISRPDEIIVILNNLPYVIPASDSKYQNIKAAAFNNDESYLSTLLSIKSKVNTLFEDLRKEGIEDVDGQFTYEGNPIPMDLTKYLRSTLDSGAWKGIVKFIKRLFDNPSHDTRQAAFAFMQKNNLPIQEDGTFLAFKVVTYDYKDKHTGTVDNSVGEAPELPWSKVDTNPEITCSRGLHACSKDYLSSFYSSGDRVIAVAIGPEDIGSIPADYNGAKLRCRKYVVKEDITDKVVGDFSKARIYGDIDPIDEDDTYDEDDNWLNNDRW